MAELSKVKAKDCCHCDPSGIIDDGNVLCMCNDDYSKIAELFDKEIAINGYVKKEAQPSEKHD
ncbi:hypothetical protein VCR14J2_390368 [Vibrio coralliirubri]|uniref:hypothetical protein n=1 Tax=Vibrio coralliirubri TaxID=1516159 RepID=UPI000633AE25|nr:hypothetical protein [Vibrio coralliirubri]CDU05748.1 hypothetical protein VCR14J2_390368 [Vibrio coralliirubri]